MARTNNLNNFLKDTADAIRRKTKKAGTIRPENFDTEIDGIEVGVDTSDADATSNDIASGKTAYVNGQKITGNVLDIKENQSYSIGGTSIEERNNDIIMKGNIPSGKNDILLRQGSELSIDVRENQVAEAIGLTSDKLKSGINIIGVSGKSSIVDTEDANATSEDIASGKTAYVNGNKITGNLYESIGNMRN